MELVIDRLGKRYGNGVWGLREFSMALDPGVLGLVGPTGAGKTTLLRMLATVMPPTEGAITWSGEEVGRRPDALRRVLGYLPQYFGVYAGLSGREFLLYIAALKGLGSKARSRVDELLERTGLSGIAGKGTYGDVRWRVGLAQALLNDPQLLLIDEPEASLGPQERSSFYDLLGTFADHRLVIVATDSIGDVASIATTIALLKGGRLVLRTAPGALVHSVSGQVWSVTVSQDAFVEMKRQHLISRVERQSGRVRLRVICAKRPHPDAVPAEPTLEDAYTYHVHEDEPAASF